MISKGKALQEMMGSCVRLRQAGVAAARALPLPGLDRQTRWQQVPQSELEPVALVSISMSTAVWGTDE